MVSDRVGRAEARASALEALFARGEENFQPFLGVYLENWWRIKFFDPFWSNFAALAAKKILEVS